MNLSEAKIAIVGLGYVGLPLAAEFATKYYTVGFDINIHRINEIALGNDATMELEAKQLNAVLCNKEYLKIAIYNFYKRKL